MKSLAFAIIIASIHFIEMRDMDEETKLGCNVIYFGCWIGFLLCLFIT